MCWLLVSVCQFLEMSETVTYCSSDSAAQVVET